MHSINRIDVLHKAVKWPVDGAVADAVHRAVWGAVHRAVWVPVWRAAEDAVGGAVNWAVDDPDHPGLEDFLRSSSAGVGGT